MGGHGVQRIVANIREFSVILQLDLIVVAAILGEGLNLLILEDT